MTGLSKDHGNTQAVHLGLGNHNQQFGSSVRSVGSKGSSARRLGSSVKSASSSLLSSAAKCKCQLNASPAEPFLVPVEVLKAEWAITLL